MLEYDDINVLWDLVDSYIIKARSRRIILITSTEERKQSIIKYIRDKHGAYPMRLKIEVEKP